MMSKKVKVLVSVLVAVVLLTVGGVATVLAQEEPTPPSEASTKGLLVRVAEKLGVTEEELANAFREVQQEIREEAFIKALDKAVENGRITGEEANEIKGWWGDRPAVLDPGLLRRASGTPVLPGRHMWGGHRGWCWPRPPNLAD